jgi:hypothetical protein
VNILIGMGTLYGYANASFTGERKANMLYTFGRADTSRFREIVSSELPKASNKFIVGTVSTSSLRETGTAFNVNYSFTIPDYLTSGSDRIYLNMNLDRFPGSLTVDDDRTMPVEAEQTFDNLFSCILKVPEGYRLEKIPDGASFSDPEFGFFQQYSLKDNTLTLSTRVYFAFQIITGEKVKQFSQMLSALQRAYSKSIVLLKN